MRLGIRLPEDGFEGFHDGGVKEVVLAETIFCSRGSRWNLLNRIAFDWEAFPKILVVEWIQRGGCLSVCLSARLALLLNRAHWGARRVTLGGRTFFWRTWGR